MRQVVLDTETTGLEPELGHRVIEIGCVEIIDRKVTTNRLHYYINPGREIDEAAIEVHGIRLDDLRDKPSFEQIADDLIRFVQDAEVIIHNAPFDVGFLNMELQRAGLQAFESYCSVVDSLEIARLKHPGQKNNLDALCKRYEVDNSQRNLHGALLDAEILCDVYLALTGGQGSLEFDEGYTGGASQVRIERLPADRPVLAVIAADAQELQLHEAYLAMLEKQSGKCVWTRLSASGHA